MGGDSGPQKQALNRWSAHRRLMEEVLLETGHNRGSRSGNRKKPRWGDFGQNSSLEPRDKCWSLKDACEFATARETERSLRIPTTVNNWLGATRGQRGCKHPNTPLSLHVDKVAPAAPGQSSEESPELPRELLRGRGARKWKRDSK